MQIARLFYCCFILAFFFSGNEPVYTLNIQKIKSKIPYGKLKKYRINNSMGLAAAVDDTLFFQLFQRFTTPPEISVEKGPSHEQVFKGETFLLGNHGRVKNKYSNDSIDIITVLHKYKGERTIYFMCYAAADWKDPGMPKFKKGQLTRPHLGPALAEKSQTDSTTFESYSVFSDDNTFRKTSVLKSRSGACLDSLIEIFSFDYVDMAVMSDGARYKNGKLEYDFLEPGNK